MSGYRRADGTLVEMPEEVTVRRADGAFVHMCRHGRTIMKIELTDDGHASISWSTEVPPGMGLQGMTPGTSATFDAAAAEMLNLCLASDRLKMETERL